MEDNKKKNIDNIPNIGIGSKTRGNIQKDAKKAFVFVKKDKTLKGPNKRRSRPRRFNKFQKSPYTEEVININRVSKTTKGGRKISFNALVVVGDKKGKVGYALGKASEVPSAIKKAISKAQKNIILIPLTKQKSIPHSIIGKAGAGQVFLRNAPIGTGVIAGSAARLVLELAGIENIYSKIQGTKTKINVVRATFDGLKKLQIASRVALLRDKDIKEI